MELDLALVLEDSLTIKMYDVTRVTPTLPLEINSMTLNIISAVIPNGMIPNKLDVIAYLQGNRESQEIYTITSATLGLAESQDIPDGVYHFEYVINNTTIKNHTFLVYQEVEAATKALLTDVNYNVEIGTYDISYVGDYSDEDLERVRLAAVLLDELYTQTQVPDEVATNDTLDKLQRLLTIITNDLNN